VEKVVGMKLCGRAESEGRGRGRGSAAVLESDHGQRSARSSRWLLLFGTSSWTTVDSGTPPDRTSVALYEFGGFVSLQFI
jgi:hypothetical protein